MYINSQQDFKDFLKVAKKADAVAIDTEFLRDKTYWPKLCLLQLAIKDKYVLVDAFDVDITEIKNLLINEKVVKVFHSPRQDIEILLHKTGVLPNPIFDTQIAASFLGKSNQIGYGNLVANKLGVKLKKSDSFTDWSMRPLSKSQLKYAKEDVTYLLDLYYLMVDELKGEKRLDWAIEDIEKKYLDRSLYEVSIEDRYMHLKRVTSLKNKQLSCAKEIAIWREKLAIKRNVPRRWVLNDDWIIEVCRKQPINIDDLWRVRGIKNSLNIDDCRSLLKAVDKGLKYKKDEIEKLKQNKHFEFSDKHIDNHETSSLVDLMSALVKIRAKENNLAFQALSSNYDLKKIALGERDGLDTLTGWRKELVGQELLDLMDGKISLYVKEGMVKKLCLSQ